MEFSFSFCGLYFLYHIRDKNEASTRTLLNTTVQTLIKATLFNNNYVSKNRVSLEVEKIFCPLGVALLEGHILIGGILVTSSTA